MVNDPPKVLIAYGSRFGSTEEISSEMSKILTDKGIETSLINLREVKSKDWPSPETFDGIIIGSGIRVSRWTKEPKQFLKKNKDKLINKNLGLFVSCADATVPETIDKARKDYLETTMEELGITAGMYDAFGGVIDLTKSSKMSFIEKKALMAVAKKRAGDNIEGIDGKSRTDFRDWEQIKRFTEKYAEMVL
ncbi:MAG: flavodoxin domain-containing protein [Candidatus Hodarchaeales archaeon]